MLDSAEWSGLKRDSRSGPPTSRPFWESSCSRRVLLSEAWRDKRLPLWNPYAFCGTPLLADVQAGVFYPLNWLLLGLDPARSVFWAGEGTIGDTAAAPGTARFLEDDWNRLEIEVDASGSG